VTPAGGAGSSQLDGADPVPPYAPAAPTPGFVAVVPPRSRGTVASALAFTTRQGPPVRPLLYRHVHGSPRLGLSQPFGQFIAHAHSRLLGPCYKTGGARSHSTSSARGAEAPPPVPHSPRHWDSPSVKTSARGRQHPRQLKRLSSMGQGRLFARQHRPGPFSTPRACVPRATVTGDAMGCKEGPHTNLASECFGHF